MGCFSFRCKVCDKGVTSDSFSGEMVKLFLLRDGKVIQEMEGEYDSYGRVFTKDRKDSIYWNDPTPEIPLDEYWAKKGVNDPSNHGYWGRVCDLMHGLGSRNGIAAIHTKCFTGEIPTSQSEDDPNQGWGEDGEFF